jgi:hypothetical protein
VGELSIRVALQGGNCSDGLFKGSLPPDFDEVASNEDFIEARLYAEAAAATAIATVEYPPLEA